MAESNCSVTEQDLEAAVVAAEEAVATAVAAPNVDKYDRDDRNRLGIKAYYMLRHASDDFKVLGGKHNKDLDVVQGRLYRAARTLLEEVFGFPLYEQPSDTLSELGVGDTCSSQT